MEQGEDRRLHWGYEGVRSRARLEGHGVRGSILAQIFRGSGGVLDDRPRPLSEPLGIWQKSDTLLGYEGDELRVLGSRGNRTMHRAQRALWRRMPPGKDRGLEKG